MFPHLDIGSVLQLISACVIKCIYYVLFLQLSRTCISLDKNKSYVFINGFLSKYSLIPSIQDYFRLLQVSKMLIINSLRMQENRKIIKVQRIPNLYLGIIFHYQNAVNFINVISLMYFSKLMVITTKYFSYKYG